MGNFEGAYDELLKSSALDHDPWSRPNLHNVPPAS